MDTVTCGEMFPVKSWVCLVMWFRVRVTCTGIYMRYWAGV